MSRSSFCVKIIHHVKKYILLFSYLLFCIVSFVLQRCWCLKNYIETISKKILPIRMVALEHLWSKNQYIDLAKCGMFILVCLHIVNWKQNLISHTWAAVVIAIPWVTSCITLSCIFVTRWVIQTITTTVVTTIVTEGSISTLFNLKGTKKWLRFCKTNQMFIFYFF